RIGRGTPAPAESGATADTNGGSPLSLSEDNPNRPARHQTLSALIEWSFALLSEREQSLLCGLSVFAGTCTLSGASAVGAVFELDEEETLDLLGGLIDKSL